MTNSASRQPHASRSTSLAHDAPRGSGPLVILLPGAGDVRSENRFLASALVDGGYRVVTADLPGHGESAIADRYGVEETAASLEVLIDELGGGPAIVIGNSFSPAAAVWAATTAPQRIRALVAISPHFTADRSFTGTLQRWATRALLRGRLAATFWEKLYRGWYKSRTPGDLETELAAMRVMLSHPARRHAVRDTLTAGREGVAERMEALRIPALVVFGTADDHFPDPAAEASAVAARLRGEVLMVEGAGHYPHVERPDLVGPAVVAFLDRTVR